MHIHIQMHIQMHIPIKNAYSNSDAYSNWDADSKPFGFRSDPYSDPYSDPVSNSDPFSDSVFGCWLLFFVVQRCKFRFRFAEFQRFTFIVRFSDVQTCSRLTPAQAAAAAVQTGSGCLFCLFRLAVQTDNSDWQFTLAVQTCNSDWIWIFFLRPAKLNLTFPPEPQTFESELPLSPVNLNLNFPPAPRKSES